MASMAPHEIAGDVLGPFGEERLVEMGVRFDRRREEQLAVEIDRDVSGRRDPRADLGDHTVDDQHVGRRPRPGSCVTAG